MARMLGPVSLLVVLVSIGCAGCASERHRWGTDPGYVTAPTDGATDSVLLQTLQDASANDWNFRAMSR